VSENDCRRSRRSSTSIRGSRLVYVQRRWNNKNIWRREFISVGFGQFSRQVHILHERRNVGPQFSPDGREDCLRLPAAGAYEVGCAGSDGSNLMQPYPTSTLLTGTPRLVAATGQQICLSISSPWLVIQTFVASDFSGPPRKSYAVTFERKRASRSQDGRWIYFGSDRTAVGTYEDGFDRWMPLWQSDNHGGFASSSRQTEDSYT